MPASMLVTVPVRKGPKACRVTGHTEQWIASSISIASGGKGRRNGAP
jgi:hypothetical protein